MPTPIIINGALGKMGVEIARVALDNPAVSLGGAIEAHGHDRLGEDYGACIGRGPLGFPLKDVLDEGSLQQSVIIDFSSPSSTAALLRLVPTRVTRLVIGTTGLDEPTLSLAREASKRMPVLVSPNMSLGMNLLFHLTGLVSSRLKDQFDIEIIEAHHRHKKDAPSGTARRLGEIAASAYGLTYDEVIRNGRAGMASEDRPKKEVGMHAVRGGDIVGDHTVLFAGAGERIELRHVAHSRSTLAQGAVAAAIWLAEQKSGFYSMNDVLGI
ncbi:MAG: 4-hydroxy-tetrahydrodipicolinate reductase [Chitinispirillaceae bacterium]|nr:4-hydroxy-tetrahydrodipicolinate reductase [Chitinispirillaceae bacterium]